MTERRALILAHLNLTSIFSFLRNFFLIFALSYMLFKYNKLNIHFNILAYFPFLFFFYFCAHLRQSSIFLHKKKNSVVMKPVLFRKAIFFRCKLAKMLHQPIFRAKINFETDNNRLGLGVPFYPHWRRIFTFFSGKFLRMLHAEKNSSIVKWPSLTPKKEN